MPVCPGCRRRLLHEQLPVHEQFCDALRGSGETGASTPNPVEEYLSELDKRLEAELKAHEEEVDRRLHELEDELRAN